MSIDSKTSWQPRIIVFACNWCPLPAATIPPGQCGDQNLQRVFRPDPRPRTGVLCRIARRMDSLPQACSGNNLTVQGARARIFPANTPERGNEGNNGIGCKRKRASVSNPGGGSASTSIRISSARARRMLARTECPRVPNARAYRMLARTLSVALTAGRWSTLPASR
mgnify:CR=1 FL=1